jgi:hypothetical protein
MKLVFLIYRQINVREVSDWNQNIINKVCSVENIAIEKIINDMDPFISQKIINMILKILKSYFIVSRIYT